MVGARFREPTLQPSRGQLLTASDIMELTYSLAGDEGAAA